MSWFDNQFDVYLEVNSVQLFKIVIYDIYLSRYKTLVALFEPALQKAIWN